MTHEEAGIKGKSRSLNPSVDRRFHTKSNPSLSQTTATPSYSLVRLSATHENDAWYQTNLPLPPNPEDGTIGPRWATEINHIIEHQLPRAMAYRPIVDDSSTGSEVDSDEEEEDEGDGREDAARELPMSLEGSRGILGARDSIGLISTSIAITSSITSSSIFSGSEGCGGSSSSLSAKNIPGPSEEYALASGDVALEGDCSLSSSELGRNRGCLFSVSMIVSSVSKTVSGICERRVTRCKFRTRRTRSANWISELGASATDAYLHQTEANTGLLIR